MQAAFPPFTGTRLKYLDQTCIYIISIRTLILKYVGSRMLAITTALRILVHCHSLPHAVNNPRQV